MTRSTCPGLDPAARQSSLEDISLRSPSITCSQELARRVSQLSGSLSFEMLGANPASAKPASRPPAPEKRLTTEKPLEVRATIHPENPQATRIAHEATVPFPLTQKQPLLCDTLG